MHTLICGDINQILHDTCRMIMANGENIEVRGAKTKELHPALIEMTNPVKRTLLYPHRGNNPFATLYETLWVLCAPSNNISTLRKFIPRADDFSDNPNTEKSVWRAGYPERIRNYMGIDQLTYVIQKLRTDPSTRQAVISLWNPVQDIVSGYKDYPCSNHIVFSIRNGKLDCTLTMRSNDIIFGMSAINIYEFTAMQEMIAHEIRVPMGKYYHFTNSLHAYEKLYNKEPYDKVMALGESNYGTYLRNMDKNRVTSWGIPCFNFSLRRTQLDCVYNDFEKIIATDYDMADVFNMVACYEKPQMQDIAILLCIYDLCVLKGCEHYYHDMLDSVRWTDLKTACDFWYLKNTGGDNAIKSDEIEVAIGHTIANSMIDKELRERKSQESENELSSMFEEGDDGEAENNGDIGKIPQETAQQQADNIR